MRKLLFTVLFLVIIFSMSGCAVINDLSYKASHPLPPAGVTQADAQKFVAEHSDEYKICPTCGGSGTVKWHTGFVHECMTCNGKGYVHK